MRFLFWIVFSVIPILLLPAVLKAEVVHLKDGTKIKGSIIKMDDTSITIRSADIGEVTFPRHRVDKISDGNDVAETEEKKPDPKIEININNDNSNKVEQKNTQTVENNIEVNTEKPKKEEHTWASGLTGRLGFGPSSATLTPDGEDEGEKYSGLGIYMDLVAYRSADFWSVGITTSNGSQTKGEVKHSWSVTGITGTFNFYKRIFKNKKRSKFFASLTVGNSNYTVENESSSSETEYTGSGSIIGIGYDYHSGPYWGFTAGFSILSGTLNSSATTTSGTEANAKALDKEIALGGSIFWAGVSYNYDLD